MSGSWMKANLILPVVQGMVGAGILAAGVMVLERSEGAISGCPAEIAPHMIEGERRLQAEDPRGASQIAQDGLVQAPHAACAHALAAAAELQLMRAHRARGESEDADAARQQCFSDANQARQWTGSSPRVEALLAECRTPADGAMPTREIGLEQPVVVESDAPSHPRGPNSARHRRAAVLPRRHAEASTN